MTALRTLADLAFSALIVCAALAVIVALIEWARDTRRNRRDAAAARARALDASRRRHPVSRPIREDEAAIMRREINAARARMENYAADELQP